MSIQSLIDQLVSIDLKHAIRLIVIIGGYWFLRTQLNKFLSNRQLQGQLQESQSEQQQSNVERLVENPQDEESWGWGKKTRKRVKRQEKLLQEALESAAAGDVDDDELEELLQE